MMRKIAFLLVFLFSISSAFAQDRTLTGKVVDETGAGLIGATVQLKGSQKGAVTDVDGKYSLSVPATGAVLVISYVGYVPQEVIVGESNVIDVNMAADVTNLEQVVVVGYGVQKKSLVTGSISKIDSKDITSTPAARLDQALQGKTSGVYIATSTGTPGGAMSVKIRGNSSNGKNDPLYIVDGVKVGSIDFLSPNDIESIEVLKDAASSAIYGAEGGNGVIIVTTKRADKGVTEVSYNYYHGVQNPGHFVEPMNAKQYVDYQREAYKVEKKKNAGTAKYKNDLLAFDKWDSTATSTNWIDQIFNSAPVDEHNISFNSSTDKNSIMLSASYLSQDGLIGGNKNNYTRYTFRLNGESKIKEWLTVGTNITYAKSSKKNLFESSEFGGIITSAQFFDPTVPVYFADTSKLPSVAKNSSEVLSSMVKNGEQYYSTSSVTTGEVFNPLARIQITNSETNTDKLMGDVHTDIEFFKGLNLKTKLALDYSLVTDNVFSPKFYWSDENRQTNDTLATIDNTYTKYFKYSFENYLTYSKVIGDHDFQLMGGISYEEYTPSFLYALGYHVPYNSSSFAYLHDSRNYTTFPPRIDGGKGTRFNYDAGELQNSYFGRFNYNFKEKLMLQGTVRRDGSSLFGPNNKYGIFPSFSVGYNIGKESFIKDNVTAINTLKLRFSWGQNGNKQVLRPFGYTSTMLGGIYYPDAGDVNHLGFAPENPGNPNLKWETSQQSDLGVELGLFKNRITITADYFIKTTKDQLARSAAPDYLGFTANPFVNNGEVQNKGLEFDVTYRQSEGEFKYSASFNASYIKNEVISYGFGKGAFVDGISVGTAGPVTRYEAGKPVWYFRGLQAIGIFQDSLDVASYTNSDGSMIQPKAVAGDVKYNDVNDDGKIDNQDAGMIGKPQPDWIFGFNFSCEYKGFDFGAFLQGVTGNQIFYAAVRTDRQTYNKPSFFYTERWTGAGTSNKYPRASIGNQENFRWSSLNIYDGDYLRLKNLTLGYTLPKTITMKIGISRLRIYGTGSNLLTFTSYKGTDPEVGMNDPSTTNSNVPESTYGIDKGLYPQPKTYTVGLNVTF